MMRNWGLGLVMAGALSGAGCAGDDCGRPICGCWIDDTVDLQVTVVDQAGDPLEGIDLICVNEDTPIASSNIEGVAGTIFDTRVSPGCGPERCNSITLSDPTGRCEGTSSSLAVLNDTTVLLVCAEGDDDDSGNPS